MARTRTFSVARGSRRNAPKLMIVMTDGASTVDAHKTCDEARQVRLVHVIWKLLTILCRAQNLKISLLPA